jgi:hypothetical protein
MGFNSAFRGFIDRRQNKNEVEKLSLLTEDYSIMPDLSY